jgi:tetratricopeptide (TPR) repeat protein
MKFNRKITLLLSVLALQACTDPAKKADTYLQNGKKLFETQQYDKATLEFKNALQINNKLADAFYYLALLEEKKQNWQTMYADLSEAVKLAPNHSQASIKLAQLKLLSGQDEEARQVVEKVLAIAPENTDAMAVKAAILFKQGNKNEAVALTDKVLQLSPGHIDAISLKTALLMDAKDYPAALSLLETALQNNANEVALHRLKIQIHSYLKDKSAAENDYRNLIKQFPDKVEFQYALAQFYSENQQDADAEKILTDLLVKFPSDLQAKLIFIDYLNQKKPDQVIAKTQEFIAQQAESSELHLRLAKLFLSRQKFAEAKEPLNWVINHKKDNKENLNAKVLLSAIALQENNTAEAEKTLNEVLAEDSRHYDALLLKAKMQLIANKIDEAIAELRGILRDYPDKDEALVLMAKAYIKQNSPGLADENFRKALTINPQNFDAIMPVVSKMVASKDVTRAEELLTKALKINPDHPSALQALAQVRLLKKDWLGTQQVADLIAGKPLGLGFSKYLSGKISQGQGLCDQAVNQYREALTATPTLSDALMGMMSCYETLKQRNVMLSYLDEFSRAHPDIDVAVALKAQLLVLDKRTDEGIALLSKSIALKPKVVPFYEMMAQLLFKEKQTEKAIASLQQGLQNNPDNPNLLMNLASIYEQTNDYNRALTSYESLVAKQPTMDIAVNNLVSLLLDRFGTPENISKAMKLAERFKDSKQAYFADSYAWALFKSGHHDEALKAMKLIVVISPDVPVFRYHLGVIYSALNDKNNAAEELKKALDLGKKSGQFIEKELAENLLKSL